MTTPLRFCTSCGASLVVGARFCKGCGGAVTAPAAPTAPGPAPAPFPPAAQVAPPAAAALPAAEAPAAAPETVQLPAAPAVPPAGPPAPAAQPLDLSQRWARPTQRRSPLLWVAAAVVAAVAAAGGTFALTRPSHQAAVRSTAAAAATKASPSPRAHAAAPAAAAPDHAASDAAKQVSALLDSSAAARSVVVQATGGLANCSSDAATAVSELQGVVDTRQKLLDGVQSAPFAALPNGSRLRSLLRQAWTYSLQADQSFLTWAQDMDGSGGCGTNDPAFTDGNNVSAKATVAKKQFVALWNATVARKLHVRSRDQVQI